MQETFEQEGHQRNYTSNQLRSNHIRNKKSMPGVEKEQLYAQNMELRERVKQLTEINTKMKTQLSITEKEKINLCHIAEQELFNPKGVARSQSTNHKKGVLLKPHSQQHTPVFFNNPLQKQKQNTAMKKLIREQTLDIQRLNNENQRLKKTMKYTRMTEILTENQELINETLRLKAIVSEKKDNENRLHNEFVAQLEALRKKLAHEKDSQKRNGFQLKKQIDSFNDLKEKMTEMESKKVDMEKRLNREMKLLRSELAQTKSKLYEYTVVRNKDCNRQDCIKNQKQRNEFKKRKDALEVELKRIKQELETTRRTSRMKEKQFSKMQTQMAKSKVSEKQFRTATPIKKAQAPKVKNNSQIFEKKQEAIPARKKTEEPKKELEPTKQQEELFQKYEEEPVFTQPHYVPPKQVEKSEVDSVQPVVNRSFLVNQSDSMDTEKLLASVENIENELKIESTTKEKEKRSSIQEGPLQTKQDEKLKPVNEKLAESDGQYQQLNYDSFENEQEPSTKQLQKETKKEEKTNKQTTDKKQQTDKNKKDEKKQKSTKKIEAHRKSEDQLHHKHPKQQNEHQDDKAELRLIKETLYYKFMAQNYSYQNFCNDIKQSKMKQFTISDLINLMGSQPFLLSDSQVQTVLMYIFETDNPTGEEALTSKDFIRKMKKFIGKAKQINQQTQNQNLKKLTQLIEIKQQSLKKQFADLAVDETVTRQQFQQIMSQHKIKGQTLQTALAHIAVVSEDLQHLNYDMFLKRFTVQGQ